MPSPRPLQKDLKPRSSKPGFTSGESVDVSLPSCDIFDDLMEFGFAVFFPSHEGDGAGDAHGSAEETQALIGTAAHTSCAYPSSVLQPL